MQTMKRVLLHAALLPRRADGVSPVLAEGAPHGNSSVCVSSLIPDSSYVSLTSRGSPLPLLRTAWLDVRAVRRPASHDRLVIIESGRPLLSASVLMLYSPRAQEYKWSAENSCAHSPASLLYMPHSLSTHTTVWLHWLDRLSKRARSSVCVCAREYGLGMGGRDLDGDSDLVCVCHWGYLAGARVLFKRERVFSFVSQLNTRSQIQ